MEKIKVLLVDDHSLFREGLANILNGQPDFQVVGEASDGLEALVKARELRPDLILMDITMPGVNGLEATQLVKKELPSATIVMLTVRDDNEDLFEAIRNGAQGYLLKSMRSWELVEHLRAAMRGEAAMPAALGGRMLQEFRRIGHQPAGRGDQATPPALTRREQDVLSLVAECATDQDIAEQLNISIHTVKSHMRNILAKLQLSRRHEAALYAVREGLIPPPSE